jgi:hypothetical protein
MKREDINLITILLGCISFFTAVVLSFKKYDYSVLNTLNLSIICLSSVEIICSLLYFKVTYYKLPINIFMGVVYTNLITCFTVLIILDQDIGIVTAFYIMNCVMFIYWFYVFVMYMLVLIKEECCICYEKCDLPSMIVLYCGHSYHKECIKEWFVENNTCPYCRDII